MSDPNLIRCMECSEEVKDFLGGHLQDKHRLATSEYQVKYPGAPTMSERLWDRFQESIKNVRRTPLPDPATLTVTLAPGLTFPVNWDVPESACLPLPSHYRVPEFGQLGVDVTHALLALLCQRSLYIWGMPGTGKDALFHAWSWKTRTPAIIRPVKPGADIEGWFFSRAFNEKGTFWEEGEVLRALRDGYVTATGRRVPYLLLVTDFDRADRQQAEHLRLIADSILGRVDGPAGRTYNVLPGTIIAATANTAGGGDERGRMISANPIDASLMDRFERKIQFHWMDWQDEGPILRAKFPVLVQKVPSVFTKMEDVTKKLRDAIAKDDLHAEFSHRAICSILGHAEDIVRVTNRVDPYLLSFAKRVWVDGLPDEENRKKADQIMSPTMGGILPEGDKSHIGAGELSLAVRGKK
jgi:MoxR-like ATPase